MQPASRSRADRHSAAGIEAASLVDVLRRRTEHHPDHRALVFLQDGEREGDVFTYASLDARARAIAGRLRAMEPPVRQALLLYPPGLEFAAALWGCLYAGVAAVPLYPPRPNQSLGRFRAIVADARAGAALTTSGLLPALERQSAGDPELARLRWLASDAVGPEDADPWRAPSLQRESLAIIQYTSGSTGAPKGVMVSHGNLLHNSEYLRLAFELTPDSVSVTWLPSFHDMGLVDGILQPLYSGFLGVVMPPASFLQHPIRWLAAITRYRATHCGGPNFGYDLCARKVSTEQRAGLDLSSWKTAYNGAEPVHTDTLERFAAHFGPCGFRLRQFYPCYGMAEATLIISGGRVADTPVFLAVDADALEEHRVVVAGAETPRVKRLVGCGRGWLDTRIAIADPEACTRCAPDRVGEIWTAGDSVTAGYWNRPELAAETFAHLADTGEGPFLRTGDLGFVRDGELFVTGRIKDVIIVRGLNYYPQDIERTAQESYPGLRAGCGAAFTVEADGEERLVIVHEVERTHLRGLDPAAALRAIREAVANEHGLRVHAVALINPATIPKTSSGKIQRHACRRQYLDGALAIAEPAHRGPARSS